MIIKSNGTFSLVQTITDSILLVVNGTVSQPVLRSWHISKKDDALYEWNRITSWDSETRRQALIQLVSLSKIIN